MKPFTTGRLIIRRYTEADSSAVSGLYSDPRVLAYLPLGPLDREKAAGRIAKQMAVEDGKRGFYHAYAVWHQADGAVIGEVGMFLSAEPETRGDLGYVLQPEYQGRGYATEAAEAMLRHGFLHWNLQEVTAGCDTRNTASFRLMERLGMQRLECIAGKDAQHESYRYTLPRGLWLARRSEPDGAVNCSEDFAL